MVFDLPCDLVSSHGFHVDGPMVFNAVDVLLNLFPISRHGHPCVLRRPEPVGFILLLSRDRDEDEFFPELMTSGD